MDTEREGILGRFAARERAEDAKEIERGLAPNPVRRLRVAFGHVTPRETHMPEVGDDVLYYEVENVPLAAKVTAILEGGVYVLAVFRPGETAITPTSTASPDGSGKPGTFRLK